ncbi:MAG: type II toxin-antitoxin system RelE/ParE family toxin [Planctomycetaceae bacterium]
MAEVTLTPEAEEQAEELPEVIIARVLRIIERLENWPEVSGARPLRGNLKGHWRIRTGDYRVQFRVKGDSVVVEKIGHRDRFYDE